MNIQICDYNECKTAGQRAWCYSSKFMQCKKYPTFEQRMDEGIGEVEHSISELEKIIKKLEIKNGEC